MAPLYKYVCVFAKTSFPVSEKPYKNPRTTFNAFSNNGDGINKTLVNAIKSNTFSFPFPSSRAGVALPSASEQTQAIHQSAGYVPRGWRNRNP